MPVPKQTAPKPFSTAEIFLSNANTVGFVVLE